MTVSIRVEPETGIAVATCSGGLSVQDAREGAAALWAAPDWDGRAAAWDFQAAKFEMSAADVREIAGFILRNQPTPPPARLAFIVPGDADFGMARMFEVFREAPGTALRVFRDADAARDWLSTGDPADSA